MFKSVVKFGALAALAAFALASAAEAKVKVAFVTSESGMGDRSFNDMMNEGMKRAVKELDAEYEAKLTPSGRSSHPRFSSKSAP